MLRREASEAQNARTSCRSSCCACSPRPKPASSPQDRARRRAGRDRRQQEACRSAAPWAGEARFEELDLQLADAQEKHATLEDGVIQAERKLAERASSSARWSASAQEAQFSARTLAARRAELQRSIETAEPRCRPC